MIRYYGLYSNAYRGKMRKAGVNPSHPLIIEEEERFVPSKGWAEMIRKVYEVDPLLCPACGGQMSIISFIEDHKVIDKIIAKTGDFYCMVHMTSFPLLYLQVL